MDHSSALEGGRKQSLVVASASSENDRRRRMFIYSGCLIFTTRFLCDNRTILGTRRPLFVVPTPSTSQLRIPFPLFCFRVGDCHLDLDNSERSTQTGVMEDVKQKYRRLLSKYVALKRKYTSLEKQHKAVENKYSSLEDSYNMLQEIHEPLDEQMSVEPRVSSVIPPLPQQDTTIDMFLCLPDLVLEHVCQYLDTPTLLAMCCVSKGWQCAVESLEAEWKRRCLKMGISQPIPGISWKHRLTNALDKLPELMKTGKAFATRVLTLPSGNIPEMRRISSITYGDGLVVSGDDTGWITVWRDLSGPPSDHFCAMPNEHIRALSLRDAILAIGTITGRVRIEYLDAYGHHKPGGRDMDPMDGLVTWFIVVPALRLLVGSFTKRTAHNEERKGSYVFWTSLDTGRKLPAKHYRRHWPRRPHMLVVPATGSGTYHQMVLFDMVYVWPKHSPDGSPYGDIEAIRRMSKVEYRWSEKNLVICSPSLEDTPNEVDLPSFHVISLITDDGRMWKYFRAIGALHYCRKLFYTVKDCGNLEGPSVTGYTLNLHFASAMGAVVIEDIPWLEKPSRWEPGKVVAVYVEHNKVYVVKTRPLGDLLDSPEAQKTVTLK